MQLAGVPCVICRQNIRFESDGTWCASCKSVFHRQCVTQVNAVCPTCESAFASPERLFVSSQFCPECMQRNDPPQPRCTMCHARTQWDTKSDYDRFVEQVKDAARVRLLRGILELAGAALCATTLL